MKLLRPVVYFHIRNENLLYWQNIKKGFASGNINSQRILCPMFDIKIIKIKIDYEDLLCKTFLFCKTEGK